MNVLVRFLILFAASALCAVSPALATSIVLPSDDRLIEKSPLIVIATVATSSPVDLDGSIWTETVLQIEETLKGAAAATVTVREPGGELGDRLSVVFGAPEYEPGARVLVFLTPGPEDRYRTVDLLTGKFEHRPGEERGPVWYRDLSAQNVQVLDSLQTSSAASRARSRNAAAFESYIRERVAGRRPPPAYVVSDDVRFGEGPVEGDFTLISEPKVYRWFAFDQGTTVQWRSHGTQPDYSGGGVTELGSAMSAWTGYSGARILYAYAGAASGEPGGLTSSNGVNEILFNDPKNEIAGTWDGQSGVVGTGGFNLVNGPRSWTSTFAADAAHPQGAFNAWEILEGNLVIQDGISPKTGIPSGELAEILAHELGHTLGFGHSADSSALMHASLVGLGPSLRSDDQLAARWLYPGTNGGGGIDPPPTVPLAPSELKVYSLSPESVQIRWKDNATNETLQSVWFQPNGETYRKLGDIPPNTVVANLVGLTPGRTYRVYVTARNEAGESLPSNEIEFTVPLPQLEAAFSVAPPSGTAGLTTFSFSDQSKGAVSSRTWAFGDGASSTLANPTHLYSQPGAFEVSLTVKDSSGKTSTASKSVSVAPAPLFVADFSWSPSPGIAGQAIQFSDLSVGSPTSWSWSFGDGTSTTERHPVKSFAAPGTFTVSLTVSNGLQTSRLDRSVSVHAGSGGSQGVAAEFDVSTSSPFSGQAVTFTDRSSGEPDSWSWDFGDGAQSSSQSPVHTWTVPGTYDVTLIASRNGTSSTRARSLIVREAAESVRMLVPVSAETPGAGGTSWRTELTLYNAGSAAAEVILTYLPDAGIAEKSAHQTIPAGTSVTWARALSEVFEIESGRGGILIESISDAETPRIHASSRTFTNDAVGTYGQFVPAVDLDGGSPNSLWLTGLEASAAFRTNLGWANPESTPVRATLKLLDPSGANLGSREIDVPARSFNQQPLVALFPFLSTQSRAGLTLSITTGGKPLAFYASVVDQRSQDPTFLVASSAPTGGTVIVPVVGRTAGAGGTYWRSDLSLFNPTTNSIALQVRYLAAGADNRTSSAQSLAVSPSRGVVVTDVNDWLGVGPGTGALEITWSSAVQGPVVTSRTYTSREDGGTFGQSIGGVRHDGFRGEAIVPGLRSDGSFRTNVGFVNGGTAHLGVTVQIIAADGRVIAETFLTVAPLSQVQLPLGSLFPALEDPENVGTFTVVGRALGEPTLFVYGSVVDRASGDPIFVAGQ